MNESNVEEFIWEEDARVAVENALKMSVWDNHAKTVIFFDNSEPQTTTVIAASREEMVEILVQIASVAFSCGAPVENGQYVFECNEYDIVEMVLTDYEEDINEVFGKDV